MVEIYNQKNYAQYTSNEAVSPKFLKQLNKLTKNSRHLEPSFQAWRNEQKE